MNTISERDTEQEKYLFGSTNKMLEYNTTSNGRYRSANATISERDTKSLLNGKNAINSFNGTDQLTNQNKVSFYNSNTATGSDSNDFLYDFRRSESGLFYDTNSRMKSITALEAELLSFRDSVLFALGIRKSATEGLVIFDSASALQSLTIYVSDGLRLGDFQSLVLSIQRSLSEGLRLGELSGVMQSLQRAFGEVLYIYVTGGANFLLQIFSSNSIVWGGFTEVNKYVQSSVSEAMLLADGLLDNLKINIGVSAAVSFIQSIQQNKALSIFVIEPLSNLAVVVKNMAFQVTGFVLMTISDGINAVATLFGGGAGEPSLGTGSYGNSQGLAAVGDFLAGNGIGKQITDFLLTEIEIIGIKIAWWEVLVIPLPFAYVVIRKAIKPDPKEVEVVQEQEGQAPEYQEYPQDDGTSAPLQ